MANALLPPADSLTSRGGDVEREIADSWSGSQRSPGTVIARTPPRHSLPLSTPATLTSGEITDRDFTNEFQSEPFTAVDTLLLFSRLELVSKSEATQWVFPLLIQARGEIRRHLYRALLTLGEPKAILDVALAAYEQYGNEDRLTQAASLLMDLGARAVPALRVLARSNRAECTFFVPIIAGFSGVRPQDRLQALVHLARNPHIAVRQSLLEATQALPSPEAISLLHILSQDPDEEIAEEARECLAHLEA
jgi:hypothetical protein